MVTLEANRLFSQLSPSELIALRAVVREQTYAAGQEIFKEGDKGDGVYVVKEGLVEISGLVDQKVRLVFSQVGPGDIFGDAFFLGFDGQPVDIFTFSTAWTIAAIVPAVFVDGCRLKAAGQ